MERKIIVITGPTCSGKTTLAIQIAKSLSSEVISADSRQFYKYLDIGTAKPMEVERNIVKHHFIDILDPDQDYNVSRFETEALQIVNNLFQNGLTPVVAGGSGLYIKSIVDGIFTTADTDPEYRAELLELKNQFGVEHLYRILSECDPEAAKTMLPQNWKRVIRALEVYKNTGRSILGLHAEYTRNADFLSLQYALDWERSVLYDMIEKRVDSMIDSGLVKETENILKRGYDRSLNSLNTVGYKEIIQYLDGKISLDESISLIKRNTRRFAKRQLTWFRKDGRIKWLNINSPSEISILADEILKSLRTS